MSILQPRKMKHRKSQRGHVGGIATAGTALSFGQYGLKALEGGELSSHQIEAARRAITAFLRRGGKVWIRIFPARPKTVRPPESGMGGGKGALSHFVAPVRAGRVIFELDGVPRHLALEALRRAARKLPVAVAPISKEDQ